MYLIIDATPGPEYNELLTIMEGFGCRLASEEVIHEWMSSVARSQSRDKVREQTERLIGSGEAPILIPLTGRDTASLPALDEIDQSALLLFYSRPETAMVRAMTENLSPTREIETWREGAVRILEVYRRNYNRATMISIESAKANPSYFCAACSSRFGTKKGGKALSESAEGTENNTLHHLIAAQMVSQADEIQHLINQLDACAIPLGPQTDLYKIDCEQIYLAQKEERDIRERCAELEEDNEIMLSHLHQVQEELEKYYLEVRKEAEKRTDAETKLASESRRAQTLNSQQQKAVMEKQRLEKQLLSANATLSTILRSNSWKLTRPLRVIRRLISGQPLRPQAN